MIVVSSRFGNECRGRGIDMEQSQSNRNVVARAVFFKPADGVQGSLTVVTGRVAPHRHIRQKPMEQFALNPVVRVGMELSQRQEEEHPNQICGDAVNVVDYHKQYPEYGPRIFDDVSGGERKESKLISDN